MSEVRVTELDVTKQTWGEKKVSFWLSRAQTRLAYLATVSCGIQGRPVAPRAARRFHDSSSSSSSSSLHLGPLFIVDDESLNDYIWRWHKLIPASLAKSCSPPDYAKQAYILSL